jgi:hypothetical protein
MGREIRRVPPNWEHPRWTEEDLNNSSCSNKEVGDYKSMYDQTYKEACKEWKEAFYKWESGERPSYISEESRNKEYWDYHGSPPDKDYYRPEFNEEPTWYQAYQTVSEGTPVSPPFATEDELIDYLVANGDFWFQNDIKRYGRSNYRSKPSRESATAFVKGGWAPSMVVTNTSNGVDIKTGVNSLPV